MWDVIMYSRPLYLLLAPKSTVAIRDKASSLNQFINMAFLWILLWLNWTPNIYYRLQTGRDSSRFTFVTNSIFPFTFSMLSYAVYKKNSGVLDIFSYTVLLKCVLADFWKDSPTDPWRTENVIDALWVRWYVSFLLYPSFRCCLKL